MKSLVRTLYTMGATGLVGAIIATLIAPTIIRVLFTPPVSFGVNCEPAATWSMESVIKSQVIGIVVGALVGLVLYIYFSKKKNPNQLS